MDLYRAALGDSRAWLTSVRRDRMAIVVELLLVVSYVAIRAADMDRPWLISWTVLLGVVSVVAPASGLTAFVAVVPFSEWLLIDRDTGVKILVPPLLGIGLLLRLVVERPRLRVGLVTGLAIGVLVGTGLGVAHSAARFGGEFGFRAIVYWAGGLGGGMIVLLVARHAGRARNLRPLVAATASIAVAALASLVDFLDSDVVRTSALRWLMRPTGDFSRLTGIIPAPNAVAALLLTGVAVVVACLVFWRRPRSSPLRVLLLAPVAWSLVAIWFTYSRTGVLGVFLLVVLYAIWWQRRFGLLLLLALLAVAVVAIPAYLQVRAGAVGAGASSADFWLLSQSDADRVRAWDAAWRMWLDSPVTGAGTLAFWQLHDAFGSPTLSAPHNEVLRLMAETGIVVAATFVALCLAIGSQLWRARAPLALGSLGVLVTLLAAGVFNNPLGYVQVGIPVFTIIGIGLGFTSEPPGRVDDSP